MKYEYAYEEVAWHGMMTLRESEHRAIIAQRAVDGWRFVGVVPTTMNTEGTWRTADLVFERELT